MKLGQPTHTFSEMRNVQSRRLILRLFPTSILNKCYIDIHQNVLDALETDLDVVHDEKLVLFGPGTVDDVHKLWQNIQSVVRLKERFQHWQESFIEADLSFISLQLDVEISTEKLAY